MNEEINGRGKIINDLLKQIFNLREYMETMNVDRATLDNIQFGKLPKSLDINHP